MVSIKNTRYVFVSDRSTADVYLVGANETLRKEVRLILFQTCSNEIRWSKELTGKRFDLQNTSLSQKLG